MWSGQEAGRAAAERARGPRMPPRPSTIESSEPEPLARAPGARTARDVKASLEPELLVDRRARPGADGSTADPRSASGGRPHAGCAPGTTVECRSRRRPSVADTWTEALEQQAGERERRERGRPRRPASASTSKPAGRRRRSGRSPFSGLDARGAAAFRSVITAGSDVA